MTAVLNILHKDLEISKMFPTFVEQNRRNIDSDTNTYVTADKAALTCGKSTSVFLTVLRHFTGRVASFVFIHTQNFIPQMQNRDENLNNKTAQGASGSTANTRKRVTSTCAKVARNLYQIKMELTVSHHEPDGRTRHCGVIYTDIYQAASELEAIGVALMHVRSKYSAYYDIDLKSIKREQTYNI